MPYILDWHYQGANAGYRCQPFTGACGEYQGRVEAASSSHRMQTSLILVFPMCPSEAVWRLMYALRLTCYAALLRHIKHARASMSDSKEAVVRGAASR